MEKVKKVKIFFGLFYLILLSGFLFFFFSKFTLEEISSYQFIQSNRDYFFQLKETNLILISLIFFIGSIIFVLMLGFGSPVALLGGFIFGKWIGTLIVALGLSIGATFLYIFANYFLKDFIREKFLHKFKNLEKKFKKNELIYFFLYRFVGGIPFQLANVLPVLFNVSIKNYLIGTIAGIMPSLFIIVSLGSGIEKIINRNEQAPSIIDLLFSPEIYFPISLFVLLILTIIIIKKFFYNN
ncbi:VTT domain-containing protein [Candidatus Pelagibacter sp.]|nr:VTT domain-containing protein [Candidatus Pelagibacter sp.]MDC0855472.1 VTT domain-containing protein [Candidatus Pelagibacter sp.]